MAAAVVAGIHVAQRSVTRTLQDLLRRETAAAVELLRESQRSEPLDSVFAGRWRITAETDLLLDEAIVYRTAAGHAAKASLYDEESWYQTGTLYLDPPSDRATQLPLRIHLSALLAILIVAGVIALTLRPSQGSPGGTAVLGALLLVLAMAPLLISRHWAVRELSSATDRLVRVSERSLQLAPDLQSVMERPGGVGQLTGLPFLLRGQDGEVAFSTLPTTATEDLAAVPPPALGRTLADRVEYAVIDVESVRVVVLPYEHTHGPTTVIVVIGLVGVFVAMLLLTLAGMLDQPRAFHRNTVAWSFLAPAAIHLGIFTIAPLLFAAWLSLHRWSLLDAARPLVGLANYARLLGDGAFWNAIRNTAVFSLHVPLAMAIALAIALVVHRRVRGIVILRAALFLPTITSLVAIAMVWQWMLHDEYGLLNWLLSIVGLGPVHWLSSPSTALLSIMIMSVWMILGYQMVLFQAGLAAIPQELYDAALIDGAGAWRRFIHVTLPGLRHTLFFVLITSVIGSFQVFGAVYVMTEGGPLDATDVAVFHIYEEAWGFFRFGDAAAMSWVLFAIIFIVTWLQFRTLERRTEEAA
jgi:multiple sugar transport system permease protein